MKAIQQKYKGDRQKLNEELMKFYRENNINPAASCLPLRRPVPGLHRALLHAATTSRTTSPARGCTSSRTSRDKTTAHWSGYILLAIYAGSQVASTYFMGATMDKTQRTIMMVLPLVFLTVVARFPTGLVLYWMTTNLWTVGQGLITRRLVRSTPPRRQPSRASTAPKRSSRTPAESEPEPEPGAEAGHAGACAGAPRRVQRKKGGARR